MLCLHGVVPCVPLAVFVYTIRTSSGSEPLAPELRPCRLPIPAQALNEDEVDQFECTVTGELEDAVVHH